MDSHTLRIERQRRGLSLRALADHLGVSWSTLARIERGAGQAAPHTRMLLAHWLDPQSPVRCGCRRCTRASGEVRLRLLEMRLGAIERLLERLYVAHILREYGKVVEEDS